MYVCTMCMPDAQGGQKRVLSPPRLELQIFENHHIELNLEPLKRQLGVLSC